MDNRTAKRLRTLEGVIRLQLAVIIALIIGLCAAVTTTNEVTKKYESNITAVETVNH